MYIAISFIGPKLRSWKIKMEELKEIILMSGEEQKSEEEIEEP